MRMPIQYQHASVPSTAMDFSSVFSASQSAGFSASPGRKAGNDNTRARQRLGLFSRVYECQPIYPANSLEGVEHVERMHLQKVLQQIIDSLAHRDII